MTTQHRLITDAAIAEAVPLLREAAFQIADAQVRYVGTIGGDVANGDPGNDIPGVMRCLGAVFELIGPDGTRPVPARAFYEAAYVTALADDEILTRIRVPIPLAGHGPAYEKQKTPDRRFMRPQLPLSSSRPKAGAAPRPASP